MGVDIANPPSDWTVEGCEIQNVIAGTPAARAGLVGAKNRTDPVGDVISEVKTGATAQPITDCQQLKTFLAGTHPGQTIGLTYWHRKVFILGKWVAKKTQATLASLPKSGQHIACPGPISGTITSAKAGNRIPLSVHLTGPQGSLVIAAILDTGANLNTFPNQDLLAAGFHAYGQTRLGGLVPNATVEAYEYVIPGRDLQISDQGVWTPLAKGNLHVWGVPQGVISIIGPEILKQGAGFLTSKNHWALTPPC